MVSEAKHSPGPWVITRRALGDGDRVRVYSRGLFVALVGEKSNLSYKIEANARLIAAAPDLLAACQYVADCSGHALDAVQANTLRKRCLAAIAKANGEST